jgi:hypothetical protein
MSEHPVVRWVVNSLGQLGVQVGEDYYFYDKGRTFQFDAAALNWNGEPVLVRSAGKHEFGEEILSGRMFDNDWLTSGDWRPLPVPSAVRSQEGTR